MIRTIIIDDEPATVDVLATLLKRKCSNTVEIIATSHSPLQGRKLIEQLSPDLVFLDIEMADLTAIDLFRSFTNPSFRVVFVIGFDHNAVEAFRVNAIDYLVRPLKPEHVVGVIEKIRRERDKAQNIGNQLHHLEELLAHNFPFPRTRLGISMADKIVFVTVADIIYCEANGSYTNVYLNDGRKMVASKSLAEFELQLAEHSFFRIHRSSLVNLSRIKEIQRDDGGCVIMENGKQLEVSQRKHKEFMDLINIIAI